MTTENLFRIAAIAIFLAGAFISTYYRRKADRETGEKISSRAEGLPIMIALRVAGLSLWLAVFAYLLNPAWVSWARVGLPLWMRWLGLGLGLLADLFSYWVFSNLGNNVSPTVATRTSHQLVTSGPYRWMRHPLYSMGMIAYIGFALLSANWFIGLMAIIVFMILIIRVAQEEAHLIEKFGNDYRNYMKRTGAFLPRIHFQAEGKE